MGIEPTALAWEARVLPLYDARVAWHFMRGCQTLASTRNDKRVFALVLLDVLVDGDEGVRAKVDHLY
jgi:hypothetical protein